MFTISLQLWALLVATVGVMTEIPLGDPGGI